MMQIRCYKLPIGLIALAGSFVLSPLVPAQSANRSADAAPPTNGTAAAALDPVAIQALKTMSDQLRGAQSFSFTARIMR